jgi:hypothetical protein
MAAAPATMIVQVPLALPRAYAHATELPHVNTADRGGRAGDVYREYLTICISCISDDVRGSSEGALTVGRVGAGLRPPDRGAAVATGCIRDGARQRQLPHSRGQYSMHLHICTCVHLFYNYKTNVDIIKQM